MSRAFVKDDDAIVDLAVPKTPRNHPYYMTPQGYAALARALADSQAAGDEKHAEEIQERLDEAIVVHPEAQPPDTVAFGALVTVEGPERRKTAYRIVGEDEADPLKGRISWLSPLAKALLDRHAGDRVVWQRPAGNVPLRIVSIAYS